MPIRLFRPESDPASSSRGNTHTYPWRKLASALAIGSALTLISASALGDVRGSLTVPTDFPSVVAPPAESDAARARYWDEWNGFLEPRPHPVDVGREIAVVLTGSGAASLGEQPSLRLHNGSLFPSTMVIRVGVANDLRNDDACSYEIFAEGLQELSAVQTAPGNARPINVSAAGHWPLRDRNYGHIQGHLHALPDLVARAFVEPAGGYVFRGIEAGTYNLHVYQGEREIAPAQAVTVGDNRELTVAPIALQR